MVKTISIHSSRGGTGKSLISSNISALFASEGYNIALLDFDFRAPSLLTIFQAKKRVNKWVNDYLEGKASLSEIMVDFSSKYNTKGKLMIGFANPDIKAIGMIARKDRKWQMKALRRIIAMKKELETLKIDFIILDTSPGVLYSSVNAIVSSDISVIVSSTDLLDLEGAQRMIKDLYRPFDKNASIIINKAAPHMFISEVKRNNLLKDIENTFNRTPLAIIPCYCDILLTQRVTIFVFNNIEHPFTTALKEVIFHLKSL